MSSFKNIFRFLVMVQLCILPQSLCAQNEGVLAPKTLATESLFLNPEPWSGGRYSLPMSFSERLYVNASAGFTNLWAVDDQLNNSLSGISSHVGLGYRFSPVSSFEFGVSYNTLDSYSNFYGLDLAYVFDVTAYASRLEIPRRWQFLLKTGLEVDLQHVASLAVSGAMRVQYNPTSSIGIFFEPKVSAYFLPSYMSTNYSWGNVSASASLGVSFNIGSIKHYYGERRNYFLENNYSSVPLFALKTNLLYDAATALNLELEVPVGQHWSIAGEWVFPWWTSCGGSFNSWQSDNDRNTFQLLQGNIEAKYWFGNRTYRPVMTGWHLGFYSGGGLYDFEYNLSGYQGEFFIAAGLSGGYAHTINKSGSLRMEYSVAAGYLKTRYNKYAEHLGIDNSWHTIREESGNYTWIGPTRARVSLVWMLNRNVNMQK